MRQWARMSRLLAASAAVQMWQRRSLALAAMFAWTGEWQGLGFEAQNLTMTYGALRAAIFCGQMELTDWFLGL